MHTVQILDKFKDIQNNFNKETSEVSDMKH